MLLANKEEALAITDASSAEQALEKLSALVPSVVVTCGELGAIGTHEGITWQIPACIPHAPIVDSTGAGDVFAGAFLAGIMHNAPIEVAAQGAARMASIVITQRGAHLPQEAQSHWEINPASANFYLK
jgi:sugar/nucleoside kinase (ribokinase family)